MDSRARFIEQTALKIFEEYFGRKCAPSDKNDSEEFRMILEDVLYCFNNIEQRNIKFTVEHFTGDIMISTNFDTYEDAMIHCYKIMSLFPNAWEEFTKCGCRAYFVNRKFGHDADETISLIMK